MALFDFFSSKKRKERALWAKRDTMSDVLP
jgi:hypothetical protein